MEAVLLVIHLIVAISIVVAVLLQPAETGGFMGSSGSMSNMMMPRRSADFMTRLTTLLAGCFFATSLFLAILASHRPEAKGILDLAKEGTDTPAVTAPVVVPPAAVEPEKPTTPKAPVSK